MKFYKPSEKEEEKKKIISNKGPSPTSYKVEESYKAQSKYYSSIRFSLGKSQRITLTDWTAKKKEYLPGVGKYDITKADNLLTQGANKSYK
jgi:hypothetical protein